jgi:hypothetical protein
MAGGAALLLTVALVLWFAMGCSSTHTSTSSDSGPGNGFTNASLKGNYIYSIGGSYFGTAGDNGFYQRQGTFVADGNGHINSGTDDFVQGSTPATSSVTGSYTIQSDGTGLLMLNVGTMQLQLAFTMTSSSRLTMIEFDSFASGSGGAVLQTTSAFTSTPSGTFIFHVHSFQSNTGARLAISSVGSMTVVKGSVTGNEDVIRTGVFSSTTLTGSLSAPDATGKGSLTLTDAEGFTSTYFYYVIDSQTLDLLQTDSDSNGPHFGAGRAEAQSATPFNDASLKNGFAFSSTGDTQITLFGVVTVGAFTSDGNGNIVSGSYDSVPDGVPITNVPLTGAYSVEPTGRLTITLNPEGLSPIPDVAWMVSSSRAFFLVNIRGRAEDGTMDQQLSTSFSNSSLSGQFSFSMFGHDAKSPPHLDRVGVATFDGTSTLTLTNYFVNRGGSRNQTKSPGVTYAVASNGRVSASISGLTNALVLYLISNRSGNLLLQDPNTEVSGVMAQQSP